MRSLAVLVSLLAGCSSHRSASPASFDADFVTEWGPTAYNAAGTGDGYDDCGPASLVMVAATRGVIEKPTAATAEDAIRAMRDLAHGGPTPMSESTFGPMMLVALSAKSLPSSDMHLDLASAALSADVATIDGAIEAGAIVLAAGNPGDAWGRALDSQGEYLHHYDRVPADDDFAHWITLFGKDDAGAYVVGDPLSEDGVIEVTGSQLGTYLAEGADRSGAIRVSPP